MRKAACLSNFLGAPNVPVFAESGIPDRRQACKAIDAPDGIEAIYQKPRATIVSQKNKRYPYLLRNLEITVFNHAWCSGITHIPMRKGFLYLVAVMDRRSRNVLAWRLSNTMDTDGNWGLKP